MRKALSLCMLLLAAISLSAADLANCSYRIYQVPAPSLAGSLVKNEASQPLCVYLPRDYESSGKRYGVVYFFSGFGCGADLESIAPAVDSLMKDHPCILVSVTISNSLGGSFVASNAVVGDWEDYVCRDVVSYVDSNFRTLEEAKNRAVCGHSMGGYAVLKLGLRHADIFGSVYSVDPGLFDADGLKDAMPTWDAYFMNAYGAAMAPNPQKSYPHADIPVFGESAEDAAIQRLWYDGFGGWPKLIEDYLAGDARLEHLYIDTGVNDYFPWIPRGCMAFSKGLFDAGIPHVLVVTEEGHWMDSSIFLSRVGKKTFSWVTKDSE